MLKWCVWLRNLYRENASLLAYSNFTCFLNVWMILVLTTQTDFFFACGCICVCSCASMCICLHSYAQLYATLILQIFQVQGACVKRYIKWNHIRTWKTLAFPMSLHPNYPPTIFSCAMFWLLKVWINISLYVALSEFPAVDIKRGLHYVSRIFVTANKLVEKDLVLLVFFWMSVKFSFSFETKKYAGFDTGLIKPNVDGPNFILSLIVRNGKKQITVSYSQWRWIPLPLELTLYHISC